MVSQTSTYLGELRCKTIHGPSSVELVTDAPTDNHGKGESFSPTDLVVSALGTCAVTTCGIVANRDGINLDGTKFYAEKHMTVTTPRKIAKIVLRIDFPAKLNPGERTKMEDTALTCPVKLSLHPDVLIDMQFNYF